MPDLPESAGWRRADLLRRRFAGDEFRIARFDGIEALAQAVVFGAGDFRRIVLIIGLVVALDLERQPLVLNPGLRLGEGSDFGGIFCFGFCYHYASSSFRDGPKDQTRNLEIPGSRRARPGMTTQNTLRYCMKPETSATWSERMR